MKSYDRAMRFGGWIAVGATLVLIAILVLVLPDDGSHDELAAWAGAAGFLALFSALWHRAWTAPTRALERRPETGRALTREEVQERALDRITYGQLASGGAVALLALAHAADDNGQGLRIFWLAVGAFGMIGCAVQAFRKWRRARR